MSITTNITRLPTARTRLTFSIGFILSKRTFSSLPVSRVKGPNHPALTNHTLGSLLKQTCSQHGDKPAVVSVHQNTTLTYNELDKFSDNLATHLANQGITKGDPVAVCCGNRYEFLIIQMGLGKLGAVLVPLNTAFTIEQFKSAVDHCEAKVLITQDKLQKRNKTTDLSELVEYGKSKMKVYEIGSSFNSLLKETEPIKYTTLADEIINMQFTSGTTSAPKLSCLTHKNIVNNGSFIGDRMGLTATQSRHPSGQDHICIPVPMFHCFGLVLSNLACLAHGCALVYPSESFDPKKTIEAVRKYSCTGLSGVPTMFAQQLELDKEIEKGGLQYLSKGIAAGSNIPTEIMNRLIKTFNLEELTICYGMTETSPVSFMTSPNDSLKARTSTVGKIMPHTEAMIVDPANGTLDPLPLNSKGEILVAGYLLQKEYFNDPKNTKSVMVSDLTGKRWMRTGDEGMIDNDGYLTVTGRIKDLIIRGGENIHPLEIENVLFTHSLVSQASVVGIPCDKYGEQIVAFVVPHHGEEIDKQELRNYVSNKVGPFMSPEHILYVTDFPKTASGKIRKVDLRGIAEKQLKIK